MVQFSRCLKIAQYMGRSQAGVSVDPAGLDVGYQALQGGALLADFFMAGGKHFQWRFRSGGEAGKSGKSMVRGCC
jgi:hypothetical protein